jgi:hypothetical protein
MAMACYGAAADCAELSCERTLATDGPVGRPYGSVRVYPLGVCRLGSAAQICRAKPHGGAIARLWLRSRPIFRVSWTVFLPLNPQTLEPQEPAYGYRQGLSRPELDHLQEDHARLKTLLVG